ncbi:MAG TPA: CGNR zinc finger domain-containing protein [Bryobacteraceae bacterium]|jgi:predicted RNA-binding Zn ribbon-like protein|nr:CGNR zinc finger domain-containing protein [Bryobacteraceae bacterium]
MSNPEQPIPTPFELVAGHVALDLVNTLDNRFSQTGPAELLAGYADLLRFASQSGLLTQQQAKKLKHLDASEAERAKVLREVRGLREALAIIAYAQLDGRRLPASALVTLEHYFKQASFHRHLSSGQLRPVWSWRGLDRQLVAPVWLLAHATEDFLLSDRSSQLRCCASETCRWLFLDASKNQTRRWCDMKVCGNRMKARRFYARKAE